MHAGFPPTSGSASTPLRPLRPARSRLDREALRRVMQAWGRSQAALASESSRAFMDLELTMAQFRALATLHHHGAGRLNGRELAARLHVTPGTLVPLVDRLEEQGYLRRVPDHQDRRQTWLELTAKSQHLFARLRAGGIGRIASAVARLAADDQRALARILNRIADRIESPAH